MRNYRFLVVHEEASALAAVRVALGAFAGEVLTATGAEKAARSLDANPALDLVVLDARVAEQNRFELVRDIRTNRPLTPILVTVREADAALGRECVRMGAEASVPWPIGRARFPELVRRSLRVSALEQRFNGLHYYQHCPYRPTDVVSDTARLEEALAWTGGAGRPAPILIRGANGSEKPLLARALHRAGERERGRFVTHLGDAAAADGGTLFVEEVADLNLAQQATLLELIRDGVFAVEGRPVPSSVLVIAGTGRDLAAAETAGCFLPALRQALEAHTLRVPPLTERREQIPTLAERLHLRLALEEGREPQRLTEACKCRLTAYNWPGNLGELRSVIERAMLLAGDREIDVAHLPAEIADDPRNLMPAGEILPFVEREQAILRHALEVTGGRIPEAARRLAIGRATLYRKVKKYNLR